MSRSFGLATQKGSGLSLWQRLSSILRKMEASGFLKSLYEKWWVKKSDCNGIHSSKIYSPSVSNTAVHSNSFDMKSLTIFLIALLLTSAEIR